MAKGDKIAKLTQKKFNDPKYMKSVYETASKSEHLAHKAVLDIMGSELAYQIATRGAINEKKHPSLNRGEKSSPIPMSDPSCKSMWWQSYVEQNLPKETIYKNCIEDGFVTHAFNGSNLKDVKKHGLGSKNNYDPQITADMELLESKFGKSKFLEKQKNSTDEIYYSAPGKKSMHYATLGSPERLYLGPLNQEPDEALPVEIGETKSEYMMKVIQNKIQKHGYEGEEKTQIEQSASRVIKKFCTEKPVIALVPIKSKKYQLYSNISSYKNSEVSLTEHLRENDFLAEPGRTSGSKHPLDFFPESADPTHEPGNVDDLVTRSQVPAKEISFIRVPDSFEIIQQIAIARGMKKGEKIDYFTGMPYKEKNTPAPQVFKITEEEIEDEKDKSPELFPDEIGIEIQDFKKSEDEKEKEDEEEYVNGERFKSKGLHEE